MRTPIKKSKPANKSKSKKNPKKPTKNVSGVERKVVKLKKNVGDKQASKLPRVETPAPSLIPSTLDTSLAIARNLVLRGFTNAENISDVCFKTRNMDMRTNKPIRSNPAYIAFVAKVQKLIDENAE